MATVDGGADMGIAARIERARLDAGLTRDELARQAGISPRALQGWISGEHEPRGISLARLERALGRSLDLQVGDIEDRIPTLQDALDRLRAAAREVDFARQIVRRLADRELDAASSQ